MISWSSLSTRAVRVPLALILALSIPAAATAQEQAPAQVAVPPAAPDKPSGTDAVAAAGSAEAAETPGQYTIRQGDTLWDIANAHYRDPFLWPLIWKSNPSINDPDLIYPGAVLVIPSLAPIERAMSAPQETAPERVVEEKAAEPAPAAAPEETQGVPSFFRQRKIESTGPEPEAPKSTLVIPEDTRVPLVDKYTMLNAGFVSDEPSRDTVIGPAFEQGKTLLGYGDDVLISVKSREDVKVGEKFLIYEPERDVRHPVNNRSYGKLNRIKGILLVTAVRSGGPHTASITRSFDATSPGDLITPYQDPGLVYNEGERQTKDLSGYILDVVDRRSINAQIDIVFLDKGKIDGVVAGDRFEVMADRETKLRISKIVAIAEVFLVKERTATAILRKSNDTVARGDRFQYKN